MAEPSQAAVKLITRDGGQLPERGQRDTLWLVYKWEGLQPLTLYPGAEQQLPVFFWAQGSDGQTRARFRMLRCVLLHRVTQFNGFACSHRLVPHAFYLYWRSSAHIAAELYRADKQAAVCCVMPCADYDRNDLTSVLRPPAQLS